MSQEVQEFSGVATGNGHELATTGAAAEKQYEIQSAIIIARRFPRNEADCFQRLMKACSRPSFAEDATYNFPRGDAEVSGPSVNLAREAARVWGNIRFGLYVVRDDDDSRLIRAWAWDVETNTKIELEDDFKKLIQRKKKGGKPGETVWIEPDERDLRELTNRRGAIILRNALLQVLPKDLIEDALFTCQKSLTQSAAEDPESVRKRLLVDFGTINVTVEQLERRLAHPFAQSTPKEMAELRAIFKSIADGNSKWSEYEAKAEEPTQSKEQVDDVRSKLKQAQAEQKPAEKAKPVPAEQKPASQPDEQAFTADASKWNDMIVYMSEDPDRAKLLKQVKDKFGASSVAKLAVTMREGFRNTLKDEAAKLKMKLDI